MKTCSKCKQLLPMSCFYRAKSKATKISEGYKSHCKECVKEQRNAYYRTKEGHKALIEKGWRDKGIVFTVEEYQKLLEHQLYGCAICGIAKNRNGSALCVDHDHITGEVRGLLCHFCNTALGKFGDDVKLLHKAIAYIDNPTIRRMTWQLR